MRFKNILLKALLFSLCFPPQVLQAFMNPGRTYICSTEGSCKLAVHSQTILSTCAGDTCIDSLGNSVQVIPALSLRKTPEASSSVLNGKTVLTTVTENSPSEISAFSESEGSNHTPTGVAPIPSASSRKRAPLSGTVAPLPPQAPVGITPQQMQAPQQPQPLTPPQQPQFQGTPPPPPPMPGVNQGLGINGSAQQPPHIPFNAVNEESQEDTSPPTPPEKEPEDADDESSDNEAAGKGMRTKIKNVGKKALRTTRSAVKGVGNFLGVRKKKPDTPNEVDKEKKSDQELADETPSKAPPPPPPPPASGSIAIPTADNGSGEVSQSLQNDPQSEFLKSIKSGVKLNPVNKEATGANHKDLQEEPFLGDPLMSALHQTLSRRRVGIKGVNLNEAAAFQAVNGEPDSDSDSGSVNDSEWEYDGKGQGGALAEPRAISEDKVDSDKVNDMSGGSQSTNFSVGDGSPSEGSDSINTSPISNPYQEVQEALKDLVTVVDQVTGAPSAAPESAYKPSEPTSTAETEPTTTHSNETTAIIPTAPPLPPEFQ